MQHIEYLLQHILRDRAKVAFIFIGIVVMWALYAGVDEMAAVQGAEHLWQTSPLASVLATPAHDPAPTFTVAVPSPVALEPPLVVGSPATQTSLPLLGALIAAIAVVVLLALRNRQ